MRWKQAMVYRCKVTKKMKGDREVCAGGLGEWHMRKSPHRSDQDWTPLTWWSWATSLTSLVLSVSMLVDWGVIHSLLVRADIRPECTGKGYRPASPFLSPITAITSYLVFLLLLWIPELFGEQSSWFSAWHIVRHKCDTPTPLNWVLQQY